VTRHDWAPWTLECRNAGRHGVAKGGDSLFPSSVLKRYYIISGTLSLGYGSIYALLADLRDTFGFSDAQLGVIAGAGFFAGFLAQALLARQADRGKTSLMVRGGIVLAACAMVACLVGSTYWAFVLARVLFGLGSGIAAPALRRLVILHDPDRIGYNLGTQSAFELAGFVAGPLVAAAAAETLGIRAPFALLAAIFAVVLFSTAGLDLGGQAAPAPAVARTSLLRQRALLATLFVAVAFYATIGVFESVWSVLLSDHGAETWLIGLSLSLFTVPMIFLAPIGGREAAQRGPLRVIGLSLAVAAVCTACYGFFDLVWVLLAISLVHAFADSFTMPANQVGVAMATERHQLAAGQGLLGATGLATAGAVGLAAGWVYASAGAMTLFLGTASLMAVCLGAALVLARGTVLFPTRKSVSAAPAPVLDPTA
jgi:MFS family permease